MKKLIFQGLILFCVFFGLWLALSQINWMKLLHVSRIIEKTPEKPGDFYWDYFRGLEEEIIDEKILLPIDSLVKKICIYNDIDPIKIQIHLLANSEINAFSLPNHHLVMYTGLLDACETEDQLCGVLCHEIAHMEKNHAMKKLTREIGISTLLANTTGSGNSDFIIESAKILTSTAYDREWEREADALAVEYMQNAHLNIEGFAQLLGIIALSDSHAGLHISWISTHPNTLERINDINNSSEKGKHKIESVLMPKTWETLKSQVK